MDGLLEGGRIFSDAIRIMRLIRDPRLRPIWFKLRNSIAQVWCCRKRQERGEWVGAAATAFNHRDALCEWGCLSRWLDGRRRQPSGGRELAEVMRACTTGSDYANQIGLETDEGSEHISEWAKRTQPEAPFLGNLTRSSSTDIG